MKVNRIFSSLDRDWLVIGWTIATGFLIVLFGTVAYQILADKAIPDVPSFVNIWNRWDAIHYQNLAQFGYRASSDIRTWFYPMFPWVIRSVAWITRDYVVSAFIVANAAAVVAAVLLRRLVELDFSRAVALRAVWFFLVFPTAYFLHIGYTESLFVSFTLGCILAARRQRWWLAGLLGGLAAMTRSTGVVLVPTLAVEAAHQMYLEKRWRWSWLWLGLVPLGFSVYLLVNWSVLGDPFAFLRLRKELFYTSTAWPWVGILDAISHTVGRPSYSQTWIQEVLFIAIGFAGIVLSAFKLRPSYSVWIGGVWFLSTGATYLGSTPRYTITMFPLFILFAIASANRFWNAVITLWSLFFLTLFTSLFSVGHWAF